MGDALSCGLFVLAMDPLIRNILGNDHIEGLLIPVDQHELVEIKILAYADDITVVCRNEDLQPIFAEYERLSSISGLKLNADKTEVFNLIRSPAINNRVNYCGSTYAIGRVEKIVICGMCISPDSVVEYQRNVLNRIEQMEGIVASWGRRHLTLNGRMLLAKTFLLSQIVFPAQFTQIGVKEVKKIERLIYSFVGGARNLYGPEKISRKYLKADKAMGGISGVDVGCFVKAIAIRQFGKAANLSRALSSLQSSIIAATDEICSITLKQHKLSLMASLKSHPIPDLQQIELISNSPLNVIINPRSNSAKLVVRHGLCDLYSIQNAIIAGTVHRQSISCILRGLPQAISRLIRAQSLLNSQPRYVLAIDNNEVDITTATSKVIKQALMSQSKVAESIDLNKIHWRNDLPVTGTSEYAKLFSNIWKIKNPALRAIKQKLIFKTIYSNERRYRFGLSDSAQCTGCALVESVEHQLLDCANAQRLWNMYRLITGSSIQSFKDLIICSPSLEEESLKITIIKALIQINRNHNVPISAIAQECSYFLRTEAIADSLKERALLELIQKLITLRTP